MCDCLGPLWNQGGLTCFLRKDHPYLGHVRTATEGKAAEKKHGVIQSVSRQIHGSMPIFLAWSISQNQKIFEKTGARVLFKIGFRLDWSSSNTWKCAIGHDVPIRRVTRFRIMVNSYSQCDSDITCPNKFVNAWLTHHLVGKICVSLMRRQEMQDPSHLPVVTLRFALPLSRWNPRLCHKRSAAISTPNCWHWLDFNIFNQPTRPR